jgi:hypothetical protein
MCLIMKIFGVHFSSIFCGFFNFLCTFFAFFASADRKSRYIRYRDNIGYPRYGESYNIGDNQYSSKNLSYCPINRFLESVTSLTYSSADLNSNIHVQNAKPLPVPQYHRGQPDSGQFSSCAATAGSQARQDLLKVVFEFANAEAEDITVEATELHLLKLAAAWLDIGNFKCICADGMKDMACCTGSQQDFVLRDRTLSQQDWDIHSTEHHIQAGHAVQCLARDAVDHARGL